MFPDIERYDCQLKHSCYEYCVKIMMTEIAALEYQTCYPTEKKTKQFLDASVVTRFELTKHRD